MKLKCQCCGFEQEFADAEAAFEAGWDCPPYFTGYVCCNICPAVCIVLGEGHTKAHALWEKEGRPLHFSVEKCGGDKNFGNKKADHELDEFRKQFNEKILGKTYH